ncbi:MAG: DUF4340 domain-containing protein [Burkholderiales bacterium]
MRTGLLLAAVALLAAFILFKPDASGIRLSEASPGKARSIRIERTGMPAILLEKRDESWKIAAPVMAPARQKSVANLLSILGAKSDQKLIAADISRFGLDRPVLKLVIDSEEFDFGMLNPVTGEQYVRKGGDIYLVSAKYGLIPSLAEMEADHAGTS